MHIEACELIRLNVVRLFSVMLGPSLLAHIQILYSTTCRVLPKARGAPWLSGRVFDSRLRGFRFQSQWRCCIVSLNKILYPLLSNSTG